MTHILDQNAGWIDKLPKYRFAIYSRTQGKPYAELESSCDDLRQAKRFLEQYKGWGLPETSFYLLNWPKRTRLGWFTPITAVTVGIQYDQKELEAAEANG